MKISNILNKFETIISSSKNKLTEDYLGVTLDELIDNYNSDPEFGTDVFNSLSQYEANQYIFDSKQVGYILKYLSDLISIIDTNKIFDYYFYGNYCHISMALKKGKKSINTIAIYIKIKNCDMLFIDDVCFSNEAYKRSDYQCFVLPNECTNDPKKIVAEYEKYY